MVRHVKERTLHLDILKYKNEKQSEVKMLFYNYSRKQKILKQNIFSNQRDTDLLLIEKGFGCFLNKYEASGK